MLTLKLITEETERVVKGLEKKHFPNAREAVEKVLGENGCFTYNLGTGIGYSVLDVVKAFEKASGRPVKYVVAPERPIVPTS